MATSYDTDFMITPFNHWQNARFIISAVESNTQTIPNWLNVDQIHQSLVFKLTLIDSIRDYNISMNARLITYSLASNDTSKYTTKNYQSNFNFINSNCKFFNSNTTYYVVVGQLEIFMLIFIDEEGDKIVINAKQNNYINFYIQNTNNTFQFKVFLQANEAISDATNLIIQYTDSYHQNSNFIQIINIELYIFEIDPPYFTNDPSVINANRWHNFSVSLPNIIDPNNLNWSIQLGINTPAWITLVLGNSLLLDTSNFNYSMSNTTIVSLKLINEKNAWRMYNLTIITDAYFSSSFNFISNISTAFNITSEVKLDLDTNLEIQVIDWDTNLEIPWIKFIINNLTLQITPSSLNVSTQCVKLSSNDSCQHQIYSNRFFIFVMNIQTTLVIVNSLGPLYDIQVNLNYLLCLKICFFLILYLPITILFLFWTDQLTQSCM